MLGRQGMPYPFLVQRQMVPQVQDLQIGEMSANETSVSYHYHVQSCWYNLYNNVLVRRHTASHLFKLISILTKGSLTPHGPARVMLLEL